jgi:outer membrane protein assembly factor BamB
MSLQRIRTPLVLLLCSLCACSSSGGGEPMQPPQPPQPSSGSVDVTTHHNDNARTGQNLHETQLTPANVNASAFGKVGFFPVDGKVDAQPLVLAGLKINGANRYVVFVATEHDSVYAFDADTGAELWKVSLLGSGETTSDDRGCGQVVPEIGITSTPVIDSSAGAHGTIWLVAMSRKGSQYFQRLHALDVTTGAELAGSPVAIAAQYPGTGAHSSGGNVIFDPKQYKERSALLLQNGTLYTSWASHCDIDPYTGWVIAYDSQTLQQKGVLNTEPNGSEGAFWSSGAGPAADAAGNVYLMAGNGTFETALDANGFPNHQDFGNAFTRIAFDSGALKVGDYFTMSDTVAQSGVDEDLGSGGPLLLPDVRDGGGATRHLVVGAGKDHTIYLLDRDNLGKFAANAGNANAWQALPRALGGNRGEFGMPAWFAGTVYFGASGDVIRAFSLTDARLSTSPVSRTVHAFTYPGATPSISANGSADGILWAVENTDPAVLHAYDATNLASELYNSNQAAGSRDQFGAGNKFITPTVANGKVFVGTRNGVAVFGLLATP